jgi:hypothetical protein
LEQSCSELGQVCCGTCGNRFCCSDPVFSLNQNTCQANTDDVNMMNSTEIYDATNTTPINNISIVDDLIISFLNNTTLNITQEIILNITTQSNSSEIQIIDIENLEINNNNSSSVYYIVYKIYKSKHRL